MEEPAFHYRRREGPFTNNVSRGGRGYQISDQKKGGCVDLVLTRGRGVKIPKMSWISF